MYFSALSNENAIVNRAFYQLYLLLKKQPIFKTICRQNLYITKIQQVMLKRAFLKYISIGVKGNLPLEVVQRIKLINIFSIFPTILFLFLIGWGIINKYYQPVILSASMLGLIVFSIWANKHGKFAISKFIFFSTSSLSLLLIQNSLDIDFTITGFYFPLIIAFLLIYNIKTEKVNFFVAILFTTACLIGCFTLPGHVVYEYVLNERQYNTSIIICYSIPFILVFAMLFIMLSINANAQEVLVTARLDAEKATKAKSDFLSVMTHELRTPLNGIIGTTNILKFEEVPQSLKEYINVLSLSADQMLGLVNNVLDISKIEVGKINLDRNTFNLKQLLERICKTFEGKVSNELQFEVQISEPLDAMIISDDLRLMQILNNLLSNAFKFTKKGKVKLSAIISNKNGNNCEVHFAVADTGLGIKESQLSKIFESFEQADKSTTRDYGGTGLGLSISKQLVGLFDSSLSVKSTYGEGSEFSFTIPMEFCTNAKFSNASEIEDSNLEGLNILVVEDNPVNMMVLTTFLKKWNISFTKAVNGLEALEEINANKFDLVLMDLEMPIMDGHTAIKEIRKIDINLPVLAFTAALYENMDADLTAKGFNDYVHKPFSPQALHKKLNDYSFVN
jgi:signal transduction histidine kinase/CheY-like chemotaxis protein